MDTHEREEKRRWEEGIGGVEYIGFPSGYPDRAGEGGQRLPSPDRMVGLAGTHEFFPSRELQECGSIDPIVLTRCAMTGWTNGG